jgi:hypothetical protein
VTSVDLPRFERGFRDTVTYTNENDICEEPVKKIDKKGEKRKRASLKKDGREWLVKKKRQRNIEGMDGGVGRRKTNVLGPSESIGPPPAFGKQDAWSRPLGIRPGSLDNWGRAACGARRR